MQAKIRRFREALEPVRMTLQSQDFIGGDAPNYGDYCVASALLVGKSVSKMQVPNSSHIQRSHANASQGIRLAWTIVLSWGFGN